MELATIIQLLVSNVAPIVIRQLIEWAEKGKTHVSVAEWDDLQKLNATAFDDLVPQKV